MRTDKYGQIIFNESDICSLFMQDPTRVINHAFVENEIVIDNSVLDIANIPTLCKYTKSNLSVQEFDSIAQSNWHFPEEYKSLDIAKWVLDQCKTEHELQRAGDELLKFHDRGMFVLLCYLKYLVDTMRKNNIVWGVGRGSSVASFVLFLIGVHKIDSLYYDLSIDEFLK